MNFLAATIAGAVVMFKALPVKLTPVAKPLMESVRRESDEYLQKIVAEYLAILLDHCRDRDPCPNSKIVVNLCTFLRNDPEFTPVINKVEGGHSCGEVRPTYDRLGNYHGIISLDNQQKNAEKAAFKRSNSMGRGPGRPPNAEVPLEDVVKVDEETQRSNWIQRRGATFALTSITGHFGENLKEAIPKLWEFIIGQLVETVDLETFTPQELYNDHENADNLVWILQVSSFYLFIYCI